MVKETAAHSAFAKLVQVGVVVRDVDKVVERLEALGMGPFEPLHLPPSIERWYRDKPMDAKFKIFAAMLGGIQLELVQPVEGESPHKEFLDSKGEGIQHLQFRVDDLDKEVDRLKRQGATVLLLARRQTGGAAYLDIGAGGIIVEFVQKEQPL